MSFEIPGFGGGGTGANIKSPTTTTLTETRSVTGGPLQAAGSAVSGLNVAEGATLELMIADTDAAVAEGALEFAEGAVAGVLDFAKRSGELTVTAFSRAGEQSEAAFTAALEASREDKDLLTDVFGRAIEAQAEASRQVAGAFQSSAQLEGKIDADRLLRLTLIVAGVLILGGLFIAVRGGSSR